MLEAKEKNESKHSIRKEIKYNLKEQNGNFKGNKYSNTSKKNHTHNRWAQQHNGEEMKISEIKDRTTEIVQYKKSRKKISWKINN